MHKYILNIVLVLSYTMFINSPCIAQENIPLTVEETNIVIKDSVSTDTTQVKKSFFNSGAIYKASDTVSINPNQKKNNIIQ